LSPISSKPLAPWRAVLGRALHRNRSRAHSRYVQLATVDPEGRPHNRTVVFRGFCPGANDLSFVTDSRSDKVEQINHCPWAEVCWYFTDTREQFRLAGEMQLVTVDSPQPSLQQERQRLWQQLSASARQQFTWPQPGVSRATPNALTQPSPDPSMPLPTFCVLILHPDQVDHLELRGTPQTRHRYRCTPEHTWQSESINP